MRVILSLILIIVFAMADASPQTFNVNTPQCRPEVDVNQSQYIVGYGSLMNESSKKLSDPSAGDNTPIIISDFERGWLSRGRVPGFSTTFLDVIQKTGATVNAVMFRLKKSSDVIDYDNREKFYCRIPIKESQLKVLDKKSQYKGQVWIYVSPKYFQKKPNKKYPIVQSYVDLYLTGCLQLEKKYHLKDFAKACITNTRYWSTHWVNDRIYPRRPLDATPEAYKIDRMLKNLLPKEFDAITLE